MELTIEGKAALNVVDARTARLQKGRFWFSKMRRVVELAMPAKPAPMPPPEQIYLDLRKPVRIITTKVQKSELEHV
jgi:hypothetical protein